VRRAVGLVLLLAALAAPATAQQPNQPGGGRFPRKWLMAGVGAAITGTVAVLYATNFEGNIGGCSKASCVVPVTVGFGTLMGYLIGSEMDKLHRVRYGHAPPLSLRGVELALATEPNDLTLRDGSLYVTGTEAVEVIATDPELSRTAMKARGLRGIGPVAPDPVQNTLLVGTAVGLYRFPLTSDEPGALAYPGEISALSADGQLLLVGLGPEIRLLRVADTLEAVADSLPEEARVVDLAWEGSRRFWVLTEDRLAAYDVDPAGAATPRGALTLSAVARRLTLADSTALIAAGSGGVYAVDTRDPDHLAELANWSGARFAYDVAVLHDRVYVAAGPEGLYVLRFTGHGFTPVGLSRNLGFVAAVEAGPDAIYLLDRTGLALRRVPVTPDR
jgi:hypothetical protein